MKKLPLDGVRVLDLTMMWAGPFATKLLAEMGAEVIKVESPRAWDNVRTLIPMPGVEAPWDSSFYFNDYNRDKKSLVLDLAHPRGRDVFLQVVAKSDVVIENYRADVLDNLKLGYEVLKEARDDVILVSMAGFGKTGAERNHVGFGPIIEQMGGVASMTGYGDDGEPYKTGISYGDPVGGIAAAGAVALALINRKRTGRGTFVDLAQRETMATMIGEAFVSSSLRGEEPVHRGNRSARWAPQGIYRCEGMEQWLAISVRDDGEWRALAEVIAAGQLAALTLEERQARHDDIDALISAWAAEHEPQAAMEQLHEAGVPAGRVLDSDTIHHDPHLLARGFWVELPHPRMPPWKQPAVVWRLAEANPHLRRHAPLFGEHTAELLAEFLGMTADDVAALEAEGVTAKAPVNPGVG
jgi:crotonobetainyl-CoA:carnitine CoA-transferase CaiB-like acyl-CoA transferase